MKGKVGDVEVKEKLFVALDTFLQPIRNRRKGFEGDPELVKKILADGTKKTREVVKEVLEEVREKIKLA